MAKKDREQYEKKVWQRPPRTVKYDETKHCGRKANDGHPCTNQKGYGTDHLGDGPCKYHGGCSPVSVYTKLKRQLTVEALKQVEEMVEDPMDLRPEVQLLRAMVIEFHNRYEEFKAAILTFHNSFNPALTEFLASDSPLVWAKARESLKLTLSNQRPREVPDITNSSLIVDRVGKMVERIHKMKMDQALTPEILRRYRDALVQAVVEECSAEQAKRIADKLEGL